MLNKVGALNEFSLLFLFSLVNVCLLCAVVCQHSHIQFDVLEYLFFYLCFLFLLKSQFDLGEG